MALVGELIDAVMNFPYIHAEDIEQEDVKELEEAVKEVLRKHGVDMSGVPNCP